MNELDQHVLHSLDTRDHASVLFGAGVSFSGAGSTETL